MLNKLLAAFLICATWSLAAKANDPNIGIFVANYYTGLLKHGKTFDGLAQRLPLSDADKKNFLSDIQTHTLGAKALPVARVSGSEMIVTEGSNKAVLDFKDVEQRVVYFNGRKIDLEKPVTYQQSKIWVETFLPQKTTAQMVNELFVPQARASDNTPWYSAVGSTLASSAYYILDSAPTTKVHDLEPTFQLEKFMIAAYRKDVKEAGKEYQLTLPLFSCEGGHVKTIVNQDMSCFGVKIPGNGPSTCGNDFNHPDGVLTFDPKTGWKAHDLTCDYSADLSGRITKSRGDVACQTRGDSIFNNEDFGSFPKVAEECCQRSKEHCYDRVTAAVQEIERTIVKSRPAGGSAD